MTKSSSSPRISTVSYGTQVTSDLGLQEHISRVQYNVGCSQTRDRKPRYSKSMFMNERSDDTSTDSPRLELK